MANQLVRLWIDMPNDPKWRTISRISKQPISLVISLFVHLMCDAANAEKRGVTRCDAEDLASALDVEKEQIEATLNAMNGRVLDGHKLIGWDKRQPLREDNSARPCPEVWKSIRKRIFERDNYTCTYCGERGGRLECDHIHPVARGGSNDDSNLTTACFSCNRSKRSKTVGEWRAR